MAKTICSHGPSGYNRGCRCDTCIASRDRRYRAKFSQRYTVSSQLCACGCGQPAPIYYGQQRRFIHNHDKLVGPSIAERFWSKMIPEPNSGCWLWTAATVNGYGRFGRRGETVTAQRVAWELTHGEIPAGLEVCHRCDTPPCVNPDHLFLGTMSQNMADKTAKNRAAGPPRRDICKYGHPMTPGNVYEYPVRPGRKKAARACRACRCRRWQRRRAVS